MVGIGSIWLRIGTDGGLMWMRWWIFGFHKMLGSSRVAAQLAASREGLGSMSEWMLLLCRSQRPRSLRYELFSLALTMGSCARIPLKTWVALLYVFIPCVGSDLATGWSPVQGVLPALYRIKKLKKRSRPNPAFFFNWTLAVIDLT
jgi:hypothetical protein